MLDGSMVMSWYNVVESLVPSVSLENRIGGVIVSVLASVAVNRWFQP